MRAPRPAERMAVAATFEVLSEEKLMGCVKVGSGYWVDDAAGDGAKARLTPMLFESPCMIAIWLSVSALSFQPYPVKNNDTKIALVVDKQSLDYDATGRIHSKYNRQH